jgi:hypothetical protein
MGEFRRKSDGRRFTVTRAASRIHGRFIFTTSQTVATLTNQTLSSPMRNNAESS